MTTSDKCALPMAGGYECGLPLGHEGPCMAEITLAAETPSESPGSTRSTKDRIFEYFDASVTAGEMHQEDVDYFKGLVTAALEDVEEAMRRVMQSDEWKSAMRGPYESTPLTDAIVATIPSPPLTAHVQKLVGHTRSLERRCRSLEAALEGMLDRYVGLANSGDAGNWDCEQEAEVIAAREALSQGAGGGGHD